MDVQKIFTIIAGILFLGAFFPYIRAILAGAIKPAKATWMIWAGVDSLILFGTYLKDAVNGQIIGAVCGAWIVVFLAVIYGKCSWTKLDLVCIAGAVIGIILWFVFNDPIFCIVVNSMTVFIGSIPTFISAWGDHKKEDKVAWTMFWASCIFATIAIPEFTFKDASQPITFLLVESIMMYLLYIRPRWVVVNIN